MNMDAEVLDKTLTDTLYAHSTEITHKHVDFIPELQVGSTYISQ